MSLTGKTALVTGAAQGIGLAVSKKLLENGVKVALCDRDLEKGKNAVQSLQNEYSNSECTFFLVNIADKIQFKDCFNKVISHYGSIDILINNAGVADDSLECWEYEIDVNCGTAWGCILGLESLSRGGAIVNISSTLAIKPFPLMPIYGMTKAAVVNLTQCLGAKEYFDKYGIRVMAVLPGMTDTALLHWSSQRYILPAMSNYRERLKGSLGILQSPLFVADCTIQALKQGENGSLWIAEDTKPPQILHISHSLTEIQLKALP